MACIIRLLLSCQEVSSAASSRTRCAHGGGIAGDAQRVSYMLHGGETVTLILGRASQDYVLLVTDRLVTCARRSFDGVANKNLIYHGSDGIVVMGYTGHSYIGDIPTDQWLAEKLTGFHFDRDRKPHAFTEWTPDRLLSIGSAVTRLASALDTALEAVRSDWQSDWRQKSFDIMIMGWQWNRKGRVRPLIGWISKEREAVAFRVGYAPRYWYIGGRFRIVAAPAGNIGDAKLGELRDAIASKYPDDAEALMAATIRDIAVRLPEVGPDCMSILIPSPGKGEIRIRYVPTVPTEPELITRGAARRFATGFSPWLIGNGVIAAPSRISGGQFFTRIGYFNVLVESPLTNMCFAYWGGQERRPPP
jgi:hypothetical protein